jgi:Fe-S cluster assembly protein SufD
MAAQAGVVEMLEVAAGAHAFRVDRPVFANLEPRFLDVSIAPGGRLTRIVVQAGIEGGVVLDAAHVRIGAGGVFEQFVLAEGAKLARIETHVQLDGKGAQVGLSGIYMVDAGRHADLTSTVSHTCVGGVTRQLIKGAARKGGRGVFQGKIVVARGRRKPMHGSIIMACCWKTARRYSPSPN